MNEDRQNVVVKEEKQSILYKELRDSHALKKPEDIDPDILQKLSFLGWADQKALVQSLLDEK